MSTRPAEHRICLFVPTLEGGGAERVMVLLANGLAGDGYAVDLLVISALGPYGALLDRRVRLIDFGVTRVIRAFSPLHRYLRRERPAVMISTLYYASVVALLAKLTSRAPVQVFVRLENALSKRMTETGGMKSRFLIVAARWLFPRADGIIAVSRGVAEDCVQFLKLDPRRVHTIYNPAFPDDIDELADEPLKDPAFSPGPPVVLAVGALRPSKDYQTLLRAFRLVRDARDARLVILGEGEERPALESLICELGLSGCVRMPGFVANPFPYMKRAALFVLCSKFEGLPSSLIQAMRCGCPAVAADCVSGPSEILDRGRFGALVPVGDAETLAGAIVRSLGEPADRPALVARANIFGAERAVMAYRSLLGDELQPGARQ